MFLKFAFALSLTIAFVSTSFAQAEQEVIDDIVSLSREIRQATNGTQASIENLMQARFLLEDALGLIKTEGNFNKACFDFAYEKFFASHSSSVATEKALAACKIINDISVTKFAYEKYFANLSSSLAMEKAAQASGIGQKGKLDIIKFAYEKYFAVHSSSKAIDLATAGVVKVSRGQLVCVQELYKRYFQSHSSNVAMDKALSGCSQ